MKRGKTNTKVAGLDIGKRRLDIAIHGETDRLEVANASTASFGELIAWLKARGVGRVGMEATGGYEKAVRRVLEAEGFEVVVHQPLEVRLFARLKRLKAKNDRIDASLIAAATAQVEAIKAAGDPRLQDLAERLTAYEQVTDQLAQMKAFMEHVTLKDLVRTLRAQIAALGRLKLKLARDLLTRLERHADLLARYRLLMSLPGVGPIVAASLVVRMPELGQMKRGQAAALLGVAPYDRDSGQFRGQRFISGGRSRPRRMLYLAALVAKRCDPAFKAIAQRLLERGKPAKVAIVAIMRRLIEAANLILNRGQPWTRTAAA